MAILKKNSKKKKTIEPPTLTIKKMKLLIIIVDRGKAIHYIRENEKHDVTTQMVLLGHGTASMTLDMFGFGDIKKDVVFSLIQEEKCQEILDAIYDKLTHHKGIAFTISLSSVIGVSVYKFLSKAPIGEIGGQDHGE